MTETHKNLVLKMLVLQNSKNGCGCTAAVCAACLNCGHAPMFGCQRVLNITGMAK